MSAPWNRRHAFLAPTDSIEQVLSQLWAKVLKLQRVGLNDNFFELGGHSLLAVRIIVEIEKIYNRRLPLATLLQAPTVGALAEVLRRGKLDAVVVFAGTVPAGRFEATAVFDSQSRRKRSGIYPLASHMGKDQPVYALQARGLDGNIVLNRNVGADCQRVLSGDSHACNRPGRTFLRVFVLAVSLQWKRRSSCRQREKKWNW